MTTNNAQENTKLDNTSSHVKDASCFGKVAVVYGGSSNERSVSLDSGAAVLQALQNQGVDATHFDPKHQDITELRAYDRVFNVLHGRGGEDGLLQGQSPHQAAMARLRLSNGTIFVANG
jgi:D-alanine-D-alanine ligase